MSLTVTRASADASAVSGSASPGKDGAAVAPSSAVPVSLAAWLSVAPAETSGVNVAEEDAFVASSPAQPDSRAAITRDNARAAGRATRERGLTGRAWQLPPPGRGTPRRHVLFPPPPANTSPYRLVVQDAALSRR